MQLLPCMNLCVMGSYEATQDCYHNALHSPFCVMGSYEATHDCYNNALHSDAFV